MATIWIEKCEGCMWFSVVGAWRRFLIVYIGWLIEMVAFLISLFVFFFHCWGVFFFFPFFYFSALYFGPGGARSCLSFAISLIIYTAFLLSLPSLSAVSYILQVVCNS